MLQQSSLLACKCISKNIIDFGQCTKKLLMVLCQFYCFSVVIQHIITNFSWEKRRSEFLLHFIISRFSLFYKQKLFVDFKVERLLDISAQQRCPHNLDACVNLMRIWHQGIGILNWHDKKSMLVTLAGIISWKKTQSVFRLKVQSMDMLLQNLANEYQQTISLAMSRQDVACQYEH